MQPRVLISDALSPAAVAIFEDRGVKVEFQPGLGKDKEKLAETINGFDGLAIRSATKVTAKILERAKSLKVIGRAGIGVDNVDIPAATARGIIVMNTPFGNSITTAEHAITLMLSLARQIPEADASTRAGKWEKNKFLGVEMFGKTLGIIGCGNIGSIVADRAIGLRMKVIASLFIISLFIDLGLGTRFMAGQLFELDSWQNIKKILIFTLGSTFMLEIVGALCFYSIFKTEYALGSAIFYSFFHSISAFCNAGVSFFHFLTEQNLEHYSTNYLFLATHKLFNFFWRTRIYHLA